ncbi:MAG: RNA-binding protein [Bacteroidales bacterium]|nr:RNA-binding protein [Bacteroidales bacterium]
MNIFIANLSFNIQNEDLQELFEEYGTVSSSKIIQDRATGKSKGYGFVEMPEDAEGTKAIKELDGAEYEGRNIVVKEANARKEGGEGGGGHHRGGGGRPGGGGSNRFQQRRNSY